MVYRMWLAGLAWVAVGTWAEARREIHQEDSPVLVAGIEADLAGRHCAGLKIDVERFRGFAHEHAMTHADFFMKKRSRRLKQDIANTLDQLRRAPQPTCDRLWADYGNASRKVQLLKRV